MSFSRKLYVRLFLASMISLIATRQSTAQDPARSSARRDSSQGDPYRYQPMSLAEMQDQEATSYEESGTTRSEQSLASREDLVTEHQSVDAFNSLEDGQPGPAGELELQLQFGWKTTSGEHDPFEFSTELQYTPDGNEFLRNMQLILGVPVEMGLGGVEGNADIDLGWQQRWVKEDGMMPTISTLAEIRLPTGYHSSGVDGTLTGILAKEMGSGTAFLNGWVKTANGDNVEDLRHFQWGARAGYKYRVSDTLALIGDYFIESSEEEGHSNVNALEFSAEYRFNEHVTIGPGILVGLDDNEETPNLGAGLRLQIAF